MIRGNIAETPATHLHASYQWLFNAVRVSSWTDLSHFDATLREDWVNLVPKLEVKGCTRFIENTTTPPDPARYRNDR